MIMFDLMTNREMPTAQFMDSVSLKSDPVGKWPTNPSFLMQPGTSTARKHFAINPALKKWAKGPFAVNLRIPPNIPKLVFETHLIWGPDLILEETVSYREMSR